MVGRRARLRIELTKRRRMTTTLALGDRCGRCTREIEGGAVMVDGVAYCSVECARADAIPGLFFG